MERTGALMSETILKYENISKEFVSKNGRFEVIGNVDMEIGENEFVVFLGPGQCGKTTLINIIAGLEKATTGKVYVRGREVTKPGPDRGVVYQKTALFPWLTVMGNVEFGLRMAGIPKAQHR
jgi:NitT/TauT family transport system ATP-binding protein/sulfonate transport system ATP-binding protein